MSNKGISVEELNRKRTPSELMKWVKLKMNQIGSTDEGEKVLRLREGPAKQLMEEVYPFPGKDLDKYIDKYGIDLLVVDGKQVDFLYSICSDRYPFEGYTSIFSNDSFQVFDVG